MVKPSALAVFRLITSSNFVGCSTGRSAGLAPFKILSTKAAARRQMSQLPAPLPASGLGLLPEQEAGPIPEDPHWRRTLDKLLE
jgi:hypothetical protein